MFERVDRLPSRLSRFNNAIYQAYKRKRGEAFLGWEVSKGKTREEQNERRKEAINLARQVSTEEIFNKLQYKENGEKYPQEIAHSPTENENKVIFAVSVKNTEGTDKVLGDFIVNFDFPESSRLNSESDYAQNEFSNSVIRSFVTSLFIERNLKKIRDDDLAFAREEELLQTALREAKQQNRSETEKALLVDISNLLKNHLVDYRERYPAKTKIFISVIEILNKLVKNNALSQKDKNQLIELSDEVIDEGSPKARFWAGFAVIGGAVLLVIGIALFILVLMTPAGAPVGLVVGLTLGAGFSMAIGGVPGLMFGLITWLSAKEKKLLKHDLSAIAYEAIVSNKDEGLGLSGQKVDVPVNTKDLPEVIPSIFTSGSGGEEKKLHYYLVVSNIDVSPKNKGFFPSLWKQKYRNCSDAFFDCLEEGSLKIMEAFLTEKDAVDAAKNYNAENVVKNKKAAAVLPGEATYELTSEGNRNFELNKENKNGEISYRFGLLRYLDPETNKVISYSGWFGNSIVVSFLNSVATSNKEPDFIIAVRKATKGLVEPLIGNLTNQKTF